MIKRILLVIVLALAAIAPAAAQFADQATYAGTGAGSANAQTVTLANATSYADLLGVAVKYIPGATNTGAATLAVSGNVGVLAGGPISFRRPTNSGLAALAGGEIVTGQALSIMYDGTYFVILSVTNTSLSVGAANLATSSLAFGLPVNLQLNATVGSNNLTIAVKGNNGSDPSATNPVLIPFRDVTIANGGPVVVSLQAALSFTINSTNTMGCVSGQMCRLWIVAINNAGTVDLCAFNALSGTNVAPINEAALQTSASGTNGGSSAQTYYCSASIVTSKAIRILGYVEIQEATAGTWATGPTYVQLFGPGIKKAGDPVQTIYATATSGTTANSTTKVQTNTTASITPTSAANVIMVRASGNMIGTGQSTQSALAQLSRGTGPTLFGALASASGAVASGGPASPTTLEGIDVPATTSTVNYYVFLWCTTNLTVQWIGTQNGGATQSSIILQEIMSALEPANDNGSPVAMVG